ncbi:MAG TPA: ABC transporter permease [Solirubrobacteraceae bacterium]|jgi:ribose transport system permease protein
MSNVATLLRRYSSLFSLVLAIGLIVANVIALPAFADPSNYAATLGELAPFALVAIASTPSILSAGIDISVGPLMGVVGIIYVVALLPHGLGAPEIAIPLCVLIGVGVGAINGSLIAVGRYQPVIATLVMYFVLQGVGLKLAPTPVFAAPNWTADLAGSIGPIPGAIISVGVPMLLWLALRRTAYVRSLLAVGGNDAAAYSAGMRISAVRISAYALGGGFAAVAGLAITGLIGDGDPTIGAQYTLIALAAVGLGGTRLGGGSGGLLNSLIGALCIFLIQDLLSNLHVSPFWLQVVYGAVLIAAIVLTARLNAEPRPLLT